MSPPATQHHGFDEKLAQNVRPVAPIAIRMPISRVRSVTDTSMMFMMPIPPTISETPAMDASNRVITLEDSSASWATSARLRTVKSSSCLCECGDDHATVT